MTDMIIYNNSVPTFANRTLQQATNKVFKIGETVRKCAFETAAIMAKVDETKCYEEDGFTSVHDWAMKTFGFKKSASYSLLRVGKEYTRALTDGNGKVKGYGSNLVDDDAESDFTTTQIEKMLPGGRDLAVELVDNGEITTDMTCKEIEKVIKAHTNPEPEEVEREAVEVEAEQEVVEVETIIVTDESGNKYAIPADILESYKI